MSERVLRAVARAAGGCLFASGMLASVLMMAPGAASAQAGAACSTAYHGALTELLAKQGDDLGRAVGVMRTPDAALPGTWIYAQSLFPQKKKQPVVERPCAERVKVSGRSRCVRYEEGSTPEVPAELTITPLPSTDELRIIKPLNDLVEARGAIPDVGNNGRYYWLSQRAASDLKTYMAQPNHTALCSGGKDFADFYANTLRPMQKRAEDVADTAKKARAYAVARVKEAVVAASETAGEPSTQEGAKPAAPAIAADASLLTLVVEAVGGVVLASAKAEIAAETTPLAALRRAKPALIAAQVAAAEGDDPKRRERVLAAGRAVRMLEAAIYSELYAERFKKFSTDVVGVPAAIKAANTKACTCGP